MSFLHTYHIHLAGIVQGVGFRPFVYQLASAERLKGYVCNSGDGLHFCFNASKEKADDILRKVIAAAPPRAQIERFSLERTADEFFTSFQILESRGAKDIQSPLTPDFALCNECRKELHDPLNRRYRYPFITCTQCGPRYSITQQLPFDRIHTSMSAFRMCDECQKEYQNVNDRRHYSQTNSCRSCGIQTTAFNDQKLKVAEGHEDCLLLALQHLQEGKIVAVKGTGGYLLLADATREQAVLRLRARKHRPSKPFAVLCRDEAMVNELSAISTEEKRWLTGVAAPVVLATANRDIRKYIAFDAVAPGLNTIGVMIPSMPLLELISSDFGKPLVCTSGNISGSPVIFKDREAIEVFSNIADLVITHNREIVSPGDDSVIRITQPSNRVMVLRRSRGLSPSWFSYIPIHLRTVLATGAMMKSSITIQHELNFSISQYLGSTDTLEAQGIYRQTLAHLTNAMNCAPTVVIADKHPEYFSTTFAKEYAAQHQCEFLSVQHHKAHFAAILAEHDLVHVHEPVLGVIWDGLGWGDDGQLWGGEFFRYQHYQMEHCYHIDAFPWLLGDKMSREPRLSALSICHSLPGAEKFLRNKFSETEWHVYTGLLGQPLSLFSHSMGRVFDALAALLDLCNRQSYEGEAALLLEQLANDYWQKQNRSMQDGYLGDEANAYGLPVYSLFSSILKDLSEGVESSCIAARFHWSLAQMIRNTAQHYRIRKIAFSGGVFQNALLAEMISCLMADEYELFFHQALPPNDENISFGQLVYADQLIDQPLLHRTQTYADSERRQRTIYS